VDAEKNNKVWRFRAERQTLAAWRRRAFALPSRAQIVAGLLALPLAAGGASGAYYINMHRLAAQMTLAGLPDTTFPSPSQRILIFSPHCDDETLGAGGLIADARRKNIPVQIIFMTNGDAFRVAATRKLRKLAVGREDLIRFAQMRQSEALLATNELGVDSADVRFLGYPDQGLKNLWERHWSDNNPFKSPFTGRQYNPYPQSVTPNAPYSGMSVLRDVRRVMEEFRPTDILVTHPADDHPDHSATATFVQAALHEESEAAKTTGATWASEARLHYYIVHRGDWPYPQGLYPEKPLLPPSGLTSSLESWRVYSLTPEGEEAKTRALNRYASQTAIMGRFLRSFLRGNELFAEGKATSGTVIQQAPSPGTPPSAPKKADSPSVPPIPPSGKTQDSGVVCDPVSDTALRYADPAADITGLSMIQDGDFLRVRVALRGAPSSRVRYRLTLRSQGVAGAAESVYLARELPARSLSTNTTLDRSTLETHIPLSDLALKPGHESLLWVSAETHWITNRSLPVDKTGYREFSFSPVR
jgi:LmbE family N-acetylglucosaminyl deacetylase